MIRLTCVAVIVALLASPAAHAAEGSSVAGVSGGSDIGAARLPPPGLYGAVIGAASRSRNFYDGQGNPAPFPVDLDFAGQSAALAFVYVPDVKVLGGSIGLIGAVSWGRECGRLFAFQPNRCATGFGDPYLELSWSRFFGHMRPSAYSGAYPIAEGLSVQFGLGVLIPAGQYDATAATTRGLSIGNNIWDIAPMAAFTWMTPPLIAEGTEFSAKAYWNNYLTNDATAYRSGDLVTVDFAITERIGGLQVGLAGLYGRQIEDDRQFGFTVPPDGRRVEGLSLGPVVSFDLPELGGILKIKALTSVLERNATRTEGVTVTYGMKLY
ncbi:MAG: transporter [Hyphomicrobiaceae bacterium]